MRVRLTSGAAITYTGVDAYGVVLRTTRQVDRAAAIFIADGMLRVLPGRGALLAAVGRGGHHEVTVPVGGTRRAGGVR